MARHFNNNNNFYVHLPCNQASNYLGNTLGDYTTHLCHPIMLDGDWEVALSEISYTVSWYNLREDSFCSILTFGHRLDSTTKFSKSFLRTDKDPEEVEEEEEELYSDNDNSTVVQSFTDTKMMTSTPWKTAIEEETIHMNLDGPSWASNDMFTAARLAKNTNAQVLYKTRIRPGHYTAQELIALINNAVQQELASREGDWGSLQAPQLELDKDGFVSAFTGWRKNMEEAKMEDIFINLSGEVAILLGFYWDKREEWKAVNTNLGKRYKVTSSKHIDIRGGTYNLFLHTDIIRAVHVGESMSNLLRVVEIPNNTSFGQQININYMKPQYKRVASNEIRSISAYIKDDNGYDVPFRFGTTIVTLHFRKVENNNNINKQ